MRCLRFFHIVLYGYGLMVSSFLMVRLLVADLWMVAMLDNFFAWILLGCVIALPFSWIGRQPFYRWLPLLPGMLLWMVIFAPRYWPTAAHPDEDGIRVATFNTVGINSDPRRIEEVIRDMDADIIGLREVSPNTAFFFSHAMRDLYSHHVVQGLHNSRGLALLSRFPILEYHFIEDEPFNLPQLRAVLDVNGQHTAVYVVHLMVPRWLDGTYSAHLRSQQAQALRDIMREEPLPFLLLCDCNLTDQEEDYDVLAAYMTDSF